MKVTNQQSGTNVHEIADGIYRISTPVTTNDAGGFSFNQYLTRLRLRPTSRESA